MVGVRGRGRPAHYCCFGGVRGQRGIVLPPSQPTHPTCTPCLSVATCCLDHALPAAAPTCHAPSNRGLLGGVDTHIVALT